MQLDISVFSAIHSLAGHAKVFDWAIIFFAEYFPYAVVIGAVVVGSLIGGAFLTSRERKNQETKLKGVLN